MSAKTEQVPRRGADEEGTADFASRLKTLRVMRGFRTARSFAQALSIDENRYTRWERGEVEPSVAMLAKMAEILRLPVDVLVSKSDLNEALLKMPYATARDTPVVAPVSEPASYGRFHEPSTPYGADRLPEDLEQKLLLTSRAHLLSLIEQQMSRLGQTEIDSFIRALTSMPAGTLLADLQRYLEQAAARSRPGESGA